MTPRMMATNISPKKTTPSAAKTRVTDALAFRASAPSFGGRSAAAGCLAHRLDEFGAPLLGEIGVDGVDHGLERRRVDVIDRDALGLQIGEDLGDDRVEMVAVPGGRRRHRVI